MAHNSEEKREGVMLGDMLPDLESIPDNSTVLSKAGKQAMADSTIVTCEECEAESLIYTRDSRSLERASRELPIGWRIWREQNGDLKFLCPNHNSDEHFKRHAGDYALES